MRTETSMSSKGRLTATPWWRFAVAFVFGCATLWSIYIYVAVYHEGRLLPEDFWFGLWRITFIALLPAVIVFRLKKIRMIGAVIIGTVLSLIFAILWVKFEIYLKS